MIVLLRHVAMLRECGSAAGLPYIFEAALEGEDVDAKCYQVSFLF
jgi:hypothetical protein